MFARPANALTKVSLLTKSRADLANFSMKVTLAYCSRIIPSHSLFYSSCPILLSSTADWYTLKARRQVPCSSQCSTPSTSFWLWSHSIYSWLTFWLRSKTGVGHILIIFEYTKYPVNEECNFCLKWVNSGMFLWYKHRHKEPNWETKWWLLLNKAEL